MQYPELGGCRCILAFKPGITVLAKWRYGSNRALKAIYLVKPNYLVIIPCDAMHELTNCHMTPACKADLQNLEETIANSDGSQCLSLDTP